MHVRSVWRGHLALLSILFSQLTSSLVCALGSPDKLTLMAVNDTPIRTYRKCSLTLDLGLRQSLPQIFVIADVQKPSLSISPKDPNNPYLTLLSDFPALMQVCSPDTPFKHDITHYIETTGPTVSACPRRLAPDRLQAAKRVWAHASAWYHDPHLVHGHHLYTRGSHHNVPCTSSCDSDQSEIKGSSTQVSKDQGIKMVFRPQIQSKSR